MSIGVGFAVAFAVRYFGHSHDRKFAILSAVLSLAGCVLGNYLAAIAVSAQHYHESIPGMAIALLPRLPQVLSDTFNPMDVLFYAIGVYFGYKYALVPLNRPAADEAPSAT